MCWQVLDVEFQNVKALYRRAQAYMGTADLVLADLDIKKALEADPHNRYLKELNCLYAWVYEIFCAPKEHHLFFFSLHLFIYFPREVKLIQRNLKRLQVESNKRDAKLYANMFARTIKITPNATKVNGP